MCWRYIDLVFFLSSPRALGGGGGETDPRKIMITVVSEAIVMCSGTRKGYPTQLGKNQGGLTGDGDV